MRISVTLEDKAFRKQIMWAEKTDNDTFICPKCKKGKVDIIYKDGIPKSGLRCSNCKAKYSVNLTL